MAIVKTIDTKFSHNNIEAKWRSMWEKNHTYKISDESESGTSNCILTRQEIFMCHWFAMTELIC